MQTTQAILEETQALRRCVRELAALSALAAAWSRSHPSEIADGLANVLCRALPVAFVYVRVSGPAGKIAVEVSRTPRGPVPAQRVQEIGQELESLLSLGNPDESPAIADPFGSGTVRLAIIPLGCDQDYGVLVCGSQQPDFPNETNRLLLGVAANQASMVLQRQRAEEALRRQTHLFTTLVEHIPDIVSRLDRDLRFLYISPAVSTVTGRPSHEYIGRPRTDQGVPPEFAKTREHLSRKVFETGQEQRLEFPIQTSGGERFLECRFIPEFAPDGSVESLMTLTRDVTERKRAEEALRESEDRWRFMAESMPQKIFTTTPTGAIDYFNRQWTDFTGLPFEQMKDWGWTQLVHDDDSEQFLRSWKQSIETGEPLRCVHRLRRADGAYRWHLSRAHAMRDSTGRIVMWIGSNTDIHEEKETEVELRRANADLEQFAYSASHDLQEPIRSVAVYSEILARHYSNLFDETARQYLQFITSGAQRMGLLVRDLLAYTKSANMEEEPTEEVDAVNALGRAVSNLSEAIRESKAEVSHNGLPKLRIRETQLVQLFQNLIGNAIKYRTDEGAPRIQVTAERQGAYWQIEVKDNGIGIHPEYRERVFGIFKRLHNEAKYSGTGIGLAICRRIVERNGGRIWVESEGPGKGSTFLFILPVV